MCVNRHGGSNEKVWRGQHDRIFRWRWIQLHPKKYISSEWAMTIYMDKEDKIEENMNNNSWGCICKVHPDC